MVSNYYLIVKYLLGFRLEIEHSVFIKLNVKVFHGIKQSRQNLQQELDVHLNLVLLSLVAGWQKD